MGITLHAVLQRQVGLEKDDAWMTFATEDFGKDYDLQCAISNATEEVRSAPRGDTSRLLEHIDMTGGHTVQILSEQELRSSLLAGLLPSPGKSSSVFRLLNHFALTRERGWTVRVVFWRG